MTLRARIARQVRANGPMTVAEFMTIALHDPRDGYYANADRIGRDFITAPGVSQMFGELIGAWCAHEWRAMGSPTPLQLIELGPGDGTLMRDALRGMRSQSDFIAAARVTFVEASPSLRAVQTRTLAGLADATHVERLEEVAPGPSVIVANEFLDCFPIRQFVRDRGVWRERLVGAHPTQEDTLVFALARDPLPDDSILPEALRGAGEGAIAAFAPQLPAFTDAVAARLRGHGGRALFIDYGDGPGGDTLQAVRRHRKIDPLEDPGGSDLTAHVDFGLVAREALRCGLAVHGPLPQGAWLMALGLAQRAAALAARHPDRAQSFADAAARLTAPDQMGSLFKVLCLSPIATPAPAGF
ncbi:MAG: SAM-dependent methyltransferase [Hyphomonadaceae bacterium]|nr:SAM-dependent methyltransferase [Hyphomonadaceae bacterium]